MAQDTSPQSSYSPNYFKNTVRLDDQIPENDAPPEPPKKKKGFFIDVISFTFFALIVVLPIRLFVAQPFIVSGASMDPTFATNQYLIVDQLSLKLESPQRGEVIIFKFPKDQTQYFIKRVIGLPGDTVVLQGTSVVIKNTEHPDGMRLTEPYVSPENNQKDDDETFTVPQGQFFVMGDNRDKSYDSRAWGMVPKNLIVGTPFMRLFPFDKVSIFPGSYNEPR